MHTHVFTISFIRLCHERIFETSRDLATANVKILRILKANLHVALNVIHAVIHCIIIVWSTLAICTRKPDPRQIAQTN